MRVLWITNNHSLYPLNFGKFVGTGGWIPSLAKELQRIEEVNLAIAFPCKDKKNNPIKFDKVIYYSVHFGQLNFFYRAKRWVTDEYIGLIEIKKIFKIIDDFRPEIIHVHGTERGFGKLAQYTHVPVVISIQGNLSVIQRMYFRGLSFKDMYKYSHVKHLFKLILYTKEYFKLKKRSYLEQNLLYDCKYVIGRTDWDRRIIKILAPLSVYFHNDEVLCDCFYNEIWKRNKNIDGKLVLHTTMGSPLYKGLETILEAAYLLDRNNVDFIWNIAGLSKDDFIVYVCKRKIPGKYFEDHIRFLGNLNPNDLVNKMLDANIFVSASHIENSSNSLCEAMLIGMPCIASFAGGTDTILKAGTEGILVQDGDPYSLAGAIVELMNNYILAITMGKNARLKAYKRHDRNLIVKELRKIYKEIINCAV